MPFGLEDSSVTLDGNDFATQKNIDNDKHYFESRIEGIGVLNFGTIQVGQEKVISLPDNGVTTAVTIDSVIALTNDGTGDEIDLNLYFGTSQNRQLIGKQRFTEEQMPARFPGGVIFPGNFIGVSPKTKSAIIIVYVKPVKVLFTVTQTI